MSPISARRAGPARRAASSRARWLPTSPNIPWNIRSPQRLPSTPLNTSSCLLASTTNGRNVWRGWRARGAARGDRCRRLPLFRDCACARQGPASGRRRMTGTLTIAGLGPGSDALVTPEVSAALAAATDILGYAPYVARVPPRAGLTLHASDNRAELQRASEALRRAAEGGQACAGASG